MTTDAGISQDKNSHDKEEEEIKNPAQHHTHTKAQHGCAAMFKLLHLEKGHLSQPGGRGAGQNLQLSLQGQQREHFGHISEASSDQGV